MSSLYKILVVDDEVLNVELLVDVLEDEEYQIETAINGLEAIQKYKAFEPDMILLDVMMPGMDGYEACQAIRELEEHSGKEVPIFFVSAKASLDDKVRGYEVGGNDYITKPYDNSELIIKLDLAFKEREQLKALQFSVSDTHAMAYSLMNTTAKMGAIGQLLRDTLSCNSLDELLQYFFDVSRSAELGCTIKIKSNDDWLIYSDDGVERPIDFDIIRQYTSTERIFYFGKNRALFDWGNVTLLVRKVDDEADHIAIMLDGLSAGIQFIQMQTLLMDSIQSFQLNNSKLKIKAAEIVDNIEKEIRDTLINMGTATSLTEEDETVITTIVDNNRNLLDEALFTGQHLEKEFNLALSEYRDRAKHNF